MSTNTIEADGRIKCGRCWHLNDPGSIGCTHCTNVWGQDPTGGTPPSQDFLREQAAQAQVLARDQAQTRARSSVGQMLLGLAIAGVGILVSWGSYQAATGNGGGKYVMAWGAIVFGAWQVLRGLAGWLGSRLLR